MKVLKFFLKFKIFLIVNIFICFSSSADNHNIYETLELIKKDIKTLEKAVYSGSVVRFPALKNMGNYTGSSPKLRREPTLIKMFQEWTKSALLDMPKALIVPMGIRVQELLLDEGFEDRTLIGFPHPSGANASRKKVCLTIDFATAARRSKKIN